MLQKMFAEDWSYIGDSQMQTVAKAAAMTAFQMMFRRSEYLHKSEDFNHLIHFTRDKIKFYDLHWNQQSNQLLYS